MMVVDCEYDSSSKLSITVVRKLNIIFLMSQKMHYNSNFVFR